MPKVKISEYSATANSNTDVASINIDEGCAPSGINNAIRAVMGHLKDFQQGTNGDPFNGPMNGTLGATTASTANVTTLTTSSTVTHNGGTANGVAYLNGAKVLTTGSALVFDGTNVGIGTTATDTNFYGRAVDAIGTNGASYYARNSGNNTIGFFGAYNGAFNSVNLGSTTNSDIVFYRQNSEQMRLTSTGLKTKTTISVGDATPSTSGAGITFPATQSASTNANTLDDYEEGTFTPTITIETPGTFSVTYSANYGLYVKIGKLVYLNIDVRVNTFSRGTGTGPWGFATIPFPVQNGGGYNNYITSSIQFYSANISSNQPPFINLNSNNGTVLYMYTTVNGAASGNQSDPINGSVYQLTMIYLAST